MKMISSVQNGYGLRPAGIRIPLSAFLLMLAALVVLGGCSDSDGDPGFPQPIPPETNNFLFDVFGTSPNNVFACGARGVMFRFDGTTWTPVETGSSSAIVKIWGLPGDNTLYAVGHGGRIWRNTGSGWSGMTSPTTVDLYSVGQFNGQVTAVGLNGTILRLSGSTWNGVPRNMWILDENLAPTDTLDTGRDLASVVTVNEFFLGGAYLDPRFDGERIGRVGSRGMVMTLADPDDFPAPNPPDPAYTVLPDWILRPISGEQTSPYEWVYCTSSDPANLDRNLLGTSEGWLFQLTEDLGRKVWAKYFPSTTSDPDRGIRDIWLDAPGNIYLVTDAGTVIYQTFDYNFIEGSGERITLYDGPVSLHGIWGTDPANLFIVGNMDEKLLRASHDPVAGTFTVTEVAIPFPEGKSASGPVVGPFGELLE
jgi:hypothetical protein